MKVAVLALMASMGSAFVVPKPHANSPSKGIIGGVDKGLTTRTPTSRGDASAVAPLNIGTFSLSSITDFFTREQLMSVTAAGAAAAFAFWLVGSRSELDKFALLKFFFLA